MNRTLQRAKSMQFAESYAWWDSRRIHYDMWWTEDELNNFWVEPINSFHRWDFCYLTKTFIHCGIMLITSKRKTMVEINKINCENKLSLSHWYEPFLKKTDLMPKNCFCSLKTPVLFKQWLYFSNHSYVMKFYKINTLFFICNRCAYFSIVYRFI